MEAQQSANNKTMVYRKLCAIAQSKNCTMYKYMHYELYEVYHAYYI